MLVYWVTFESVVRWITSDIDSVLERGQLLKSLNRFRTLGVDDLHARIGIL